MPGRLDDTREIMRWLATALSRDTYVNVMDQYYPAYKAETEPRFAQINRRLHDSEFEQALEHARAAGLWRSDTTLAKRRAARTSGLAAVDAWTRAEGSVRQRELISKGRGLR